MSAVTASEIAELAAHAFGVPRAHLQVGAGEGVRLVRAWEARRVAVYLARKHTTASWYELAVLYGVHRHAADYMHELVTWVERRMKAPGMRQLVSEIEDQIDELHERRMGNKDRMEMLHDAG